MSYHDKFKTVDEYLSHLPPKQRAALNKLRKTIRSISPELKEKISYGMPTVTYHGNLVHYAAFKEHLSFYPGRRAKDFEAELKKYGASLTGASTIKFTADEPLPDALVKKIVKVRMAENAKPRGKG